MTDISTLYSHLQTSEEITKKGKKHKITTNLNSERNSDTETIERLEKERNDLIYLLREQENYNNAILESVALISRLIALPYTSLSSPSKENNVFGDEMKTHHHDNNTINEMNSIISKLDLICDSYFLDDTPVPLLLTTAQRLKSNLQHVTKEAELAEKEMVTLKKAVKIMYKRSVVVEGALRKLYKAYTSMKTKVAKVSNKNEILTEQLKDATEKSRIKEVEHHEKIMHGALTFDYRGYNKKEEFNEDDEIESVASSMASGVPSVVNSTGVSTVSLKYDDYSSRSEDNWSVLGDNSPESHANRKQFKQFGYKIREEYKISFNTKTKFGLHFFQMPVDRNGHILDKGIISGMTTKTTYDYTSDENLSYSTGELSSTTLKNSVNKSFLVCGYDNFDSKINIRPAIGARLVSINDDNLEQGEWSIEKVLEKLASEPPIVLTFQDYLLSTKQLSILRKASRRLDCLKKIENEKKEVQGVENDNKMIISKLLPEKKPVKSDCGLSDDKTSAPLLRDFPSSYSSEDSCCDTSIKLVQNKKNEKYKNRSTLSLASKISIHWKRN